MATTKDKDKNKLTLDKDKLLLVEGQDEVNFFTALLENIGIKEIQIIAVAGKDNFKTVLPALLKEAGFSKVKSYGIIRDADSNRKAALESVKNILEKERQPVPKNHGEIAVIDKIKVGIFVMPGNAEDGMLENLCLKTVPNHPVLQCAEKYISCLEENLAILENGESKQEGIQYFPKNKTKALTYSFLAGMYQSVSSVGVAAQKGYFDLDSESLSELKEFLLKLFEGDGLL